MQVTNAPVQMGDVDDWLLTNKGGATVYYGVSNAVTPATATGSLSVGETKKMFGLTWLCTDPDQHTDVLYRDYSASLSGSSGGVGLGRLGPWWACNGDSTMVGQDGPSSSPFEQLCIMAAGRIQRVMGGNAAVGGTNTTQMLSRFDTDLAAMSRKPDVYLIWPGYNDIGAGGFTPQVTRTNIEAYIDRCLALGIQPVLMTILGRINQSSTPKLLQTAQTNLLYKEIAYRKGIRIIDITSMNDPLTGLTQAQYDFDNTHMNRKGGKAAANLILNQLSGALPTWTPPLTDSKVDPTNMLLNGCMYDINVDGKPDSWTVNIPAGITVIDDPDFPGKAMKIDQVASAARNVYQDVVTGFSTGDRISVSARFKLVAEAGPLAVTFAGVTVTAVIYGFIDWSTDVANGVWYKEFIVPPGTASLRFVAGQPGAGTGSLTTGQCTMRNLTTLAAAGVS